MTGSTSTSPCSEPMSTVACSARRERHCGFPWAWISLNSRLRSNFRFLMMKQCLKKSTNTLNEALISLRNRNSFITTNDTPVQAKWFREQRSQNNQKKKKKDVIWTHREISGRNPTNCLNLESTKWGCEICFTFSLFGRGKILNFRVFSSKKI